ncbi:hypothetical protein P153DRAFT_365588 [Dothidotthia symphoricarpi CBS 119687]|uniref:Uncharacterized protein n=1 Tax=Dothidotthia symphoricarpi CBS 119687 TaxID=1392245 RepID=A0A6A6AIA2_9PLEO|nr:uncharacterized protein P153DRAFT_365588 [Dothidotthia symphoricarpi CBS 119687]KAF2130963.1 hypothetical protein P153DRAFT_365588 [Dothidotthia symphoricarpi CBS 119687]
MTPLSTIQPIILLRTPARRTLESVPTNPSRPARVQAKFPAICFPTAAKTGVLSAAEPPKILPCATVNGNVAA